MIGVVGMDVGIRDLVVSYYKAGSGVREIAVRLGLDEREVEGIVDEWVSGEGMREVESREWGEVSLEELRLMGLRWMYEVLSDEGVDGNLKLGVCRILKDMGLFGRRRV